MVNFCTISIKYSYLHFVSILGLTFITILLMTSANCAILYKLIFILTLLLAMVYLIYQINNFSNNSKVDFLFDINSLIIWKNNSSQIYEIVDGCNLSSWYIVIKIKFKNNRFINFLISKYPQYPLGINTVVMRILSSTITKLCLRFLPSMM